MVTPTHPIRSESQESLNQWREKEKLALKLLKITGELRFDKSIDLVLFRREIHNTPTNTLLHHHSLSQDYGGDTLSIAMTTEIALAIAKIKNLAPAKIDIGKLALEWQSEFLEYEDLHEYVHVKLRSYIDAEMPIEQHKDVVLYGFGRIGRLMARRLLEETGRGDQLRLRAIVLRPKLADRYTEVVKRVALLETDSIHGDFGGVIDIAEDGSAIHINGSRIEIIMAKSPSEVDYSAYGIEDALIIDNTGVWRDREGLSQHLQTGAEKVLLTAPAKGNIPNIVYGVNHETTDRDTERIYSAASCTTNAISPTIKVIMDQLGIAKGHIETIHSYTNDQNLLDNFHKKPRRGRGAPINMVLTTTGAAAAVTKVIPEVAGRLTGNAIRVPTPNVSIAILNLTLDKATTVEELNAMLREAALNGPLVEQIHYSDSTEYVSSNAIGMNTTCIVDAPSSIVSADGLSATVYLWYDNEYGYCCQVTRLAKHLAKVRRYTYY